jgi:hypothetical protein
MPQDFSGQNLRGGSFKGQNLTDANFSYADIRGVDFSGANLIGANFSHAKLKNTNFEKAKLTNVCWSKAKKLKYIHPSLIYLENKMATSQSINIQNIAKSESEFMSENFKKQSNFDLKGAQFAGGLVNADTVNAQKIGGNINNYNPEQKQNLAQAAADIQQLLNQLSHSYPTATTSERMIVVAKAVDEIESNPTLKARVIGALKAGGTEALKELIDNPLINILLASIDGWQDAE